jgi:hypothetical protein
MAVIIAVDPRSNGVAAVILLDINAYFTSVSSDNLCSNAAAKIKSPKDFQFV